MRLDLYGDQIQRLCRIDGYCKNGEYGFVNFSELTKTGGEAIL